MDGLGVAPRYMRFPSSALFGSLSALCLAWERREGHGMSSQGTVHDAWLKVGLAAVAFAISMMLAGLLMPADDNPQAKAVSEVLRP